MFYLSITINTIPYIPIAKIRGFTVNLVKHIVLEEDGFSFKYSFVTPPEENTKLKEIIIDSAKAAVSLYCETGLCDWDNS